MTDKNKRPGKYFYQSQLFRKIAAEDPVVLIDVGARGGIHPKWRPLHGVIKAIGFEPDADECRRLNEAAVNNHTYFPVALFNKKGKVNINMTREPVCSSILEPNHALLNRFLASEEFEVTGSIEVTCDSLDGIVQNNGIKDIDFIKLDTEGAEYDILLGAKKVLSQSVFGISLEMLFNRQRIGEPLFSEIDLFLREQGFVVYDLPIFRCARTVLSPHMFSDNAGPTDHGQA
ncbi:MAG: FkbM family methyltransferase, partial [Chloroflexi bacterium]|nr:FkbM family methyltransferase [Chloroflexota bacterium]